MLAGFFGSGRRGSVGADVVVPKWAFSGEYPCTAIDLECARDM